MLKKIMKRTLSVTLVIMLVATTFFIFDPTALFPKASAQSAGSYTWRVKVNSGNNTGGWNSDHHWTVYGKDNNGRGSEVSIASGDQKMDFKGDKWFVESKTTSQFPTKFTYKYSFGGGATWREMKFTVYIEVYNGSSWVEVKSEYHSASSSAFSKASGTKTSTVGSDKYPSMQTVSVSGPSTVYTYGSDTQTYSIGAVKDQYSVNWGYSTLAWSKNHSAVSLSGATATYGMNSGVPYSVTVTPSIDSSNLNSVTTTVYPCTEISLNSAVTVNHTDSQDRYYRFTPSENGTYIFFTYDNDNTPDPYLYIYTRSSVTSLSSALYSGDDIGHDAGVGSSDGAQYRRMLSGSENNMGSWQSYVKGCSLTGGTTYIIRAYDRGTVESYPMKVCKQVSVTIKGTGGNDVVHDRLPQGHSFYPGQATQPTRTDHTLIGYSDSGTAAMAITYLKNTTSSFTIGDGGSTLYALWYPNSPTALTVNCSKTSVISAVGQINFFTFTPTETRKYVIYSTSSESEASPADPYVIRYDPATYQSAGTYVTVNDDGRSGHSVLKYASGTSGTTCAGRNFLLEETLTAGTTYMWGVKAYHADGGTGGNSGIGNIPFNFEAVYTVSYNGNNNTGGTVPSAQSKYYNRDVTLSSNALTRTGYDFKGWNTDASATTASYAAGGTYSTNADATLYATWSPHTYKITYDVNEGTMPSGISSPRSFNITSSAFTLGTPTRNGYTFGGWKVTATAGNWKAVGESYGATDSLSGKYGDVSVQAQWSKDTYSLTYSGDGTMPSNFNYSIDSTTTLGTPTRNGYTFGGWKPTSNVGNWSSGTVYSAGTSVSGKYGNVTLKAQWSATNYTLTFNSNGGGTVADKSYNITSTDTLPSCSWTAYTFGGWKADSTSGNWSKGTVYNAGTSLTGKYGSLSFTAQWTPVGYTVTYDANGGTAKTALSYNITQSTQLGSTTRDGYTFSNWKVTSTGGNWKAVGNTYASTETVNGKYGNVTLQAQWDINTYTVTFNKNGGAAKTALSYKITDNTQLGDTTRTGYTFRNWIVESSGGNWGTANSTTYTKTATVNGKYGNVTLKAQWDAIKYTMTFNENSGTWKGWNSDGTSASAYADTKAKKIQYDSTYGAAIESNKKWPITPTRTGYTFQNWTSDGTENGTVYTSGGTVTVTNDITVKAYWTINASTLKVNPNGGTWGGSSNESTITQNYNTTKDVADPTKTAYTFTGWTASGDYTAGWNNSTKKFTFGPTAGQTTTLTAGWTPTTYNITYELNGGSVSTANPTTYNYETTSFTLNNPTKTGYNFKGWSGTGLSGSANTSVTVSKGSYGDREYTANWTAKTPSLIFHPNGGSVAAGGGFTAFSGTTTQSKTVTYASSYGAEDANGKTWPNNPTKNGYTFGGWKNGSTTYKSTGTVTITENTTVTASWSATKYTISYDENGGTLPSGTNANPTEYYITSSAITLNPPTRDYYDFAGWTGTGITGGAKIDVTIASGSTGNRSYTANWTPIDYTITYDLGGGALASGVTNKTSYNVTTASFTLNNPTKAGYDFEGWTGTGITGEAELAVTIAKGSHGDRAYTATWTPHSYTVRYNVNGGESKSALTYNIESTAELGSTTFEGYDFSKWTVESTGGNWGSVGTAEYAATKKVTGMYGNVTLKANWTVHEYSISYTLNGGSHSGNPVKYTIESADIALNQPTRTGYTFDGWTGSNGTTKQKNVTIASGSTGDKSYTANWTAITYSISYTMNGGSLASGVTNPTSYKITTATFTLNNPTKAGYTFTGWTGSNGTTAQTTVTIAKGSTGNKNYTANFSADSYTITFDVNNGDPYGNKTYKITDSATLGTPTRTGYTFGGWKVDTAAGNWATGTYQGSQSVNGKYGNVNMQAQWTPTSYGISYTLAGGSVATANPTSYTIETETFTLNNPTRSGYAFDGWTGTDLTEATTTVKITKGSTGARSYTATWSLVTYSITCNLNGGTMPSGVTNPTSYTVTSSAITLNAPEKSGYTFTGWTGSNGTTAQTAVTIATGSTGNKTYNANWTAKSYTVTLNKDGGGSNTTVSATYGSAMPSPGTLPNKDGYTFGGYYRSQNGVGTQYYTDTGASAHVWDVAANTTIYAKWIAVGYTITFLPNKGTIANASNYLNDDTGDYELSYSIAAGVTLPNCTRSGYSFAGWQPTGDFIGTWDKDTKYSASFEYTNMWGDVELKAQWSTVSYEIAFDMTTYGGTLPNNQANPMSYNITTSKTLPSAAKTGYTLDYWTPKTAAGNWTSGGVYYGANATNPTNIQGKWGNVTLQPIFKANTYTLKFILNNGTLTAGNGFTSADNQTKTVTYNKKYGDKYNTSENKTWPNDPTRNGYEFAGWKNGSTTFASDGTVTITANTDLTAAWTVKTYSITYELDGGALASGQSNPTTYKVTDTAITLKNPTRTGYTFAGWTGTGLSEATVTVTIPTGSYGNRSYTATWTANEYTITYHANGGTLPTGSNANPTSYKITTATFTLKKPTRTGYSFIGWTGTGLDGATPDVTITKGSTGDKTYTAQWTANSYTVSLDRQAGTDTSVTGATSVSATYDSAMPQITAPTRNAYTFAGYFTETGGAGTQYYNADGTSAHTWDKANDTTTLYAKWTETEFTITYDLDGGALESGKTNPTKYKVSTSTITLNNPSKTGYTFDGWKGSNGTTAQTTVTIAKGSWGNKSYTAYYTPISYGISYNLNGGALASGVTNPATYTILNTVTLNNPAKNGYNFAGWTGTGITGGAQQSVTFGPGVIGARSYTATWTPKPYTVSYDVNGGTAKGTLTYNPDQATQLGDTTKTGYKFVKWTVSITGGNWGTVGTEYAKTKTVSGMYGNVVLQAQWEKDTFTLTVNPNGGKFAGVLVATTFTDLYETEISVGPATRDGYNFTEWTKSGEGTWLNNSDKTTGGKFTLGAGAGTLTAQWTPKVYTLNYDYGVGAGSVTNPATFTIESDTFALANPTASGWTFKGWTGTNLSEATMTVTIAQGSMGNRTYVATWERNDYTVTLDRQGGTTGDTSITATYGTAMPTATMPTKTGYVFKGYFASANGQGRKYYNANGSSANTWDQTIENPTIYAYWTADTYTLFFNPTGGTIPEGNGFAESTGTQSKQVTFADYYDTEDADGKTWPMTPVKTGNTFVCWKNNGSTFTAHSTVSITGDTILEAEWTKQSFTLAFNANGVTATMPGSKTLYYDTQSTYGGKPTNVTGGWTFRGWSADKNTTSGDVAAENSKITTTTVNSWFGETGVGAGGTKTVYAIWQKTLTGTFTDTTSSQTASVTIYNGATSGTITAPTQRVYTGWTAKGWTTDTAADATASTAGTYTISANTQYYGRYERTLTVTYEKNGGKTTPTATSVTQQMNANSTAVWTNTQATLAGAIARDGYTFSGWKIGSTTYSAGGKYTITSNVTATAQWTLRAYTVTIDPDGGTVSDVEYYETGTTASDKTQSGEIADATGLTMVHSTTATIALPERDGYTFTGWTVTATSGSAPSDGVMTNSTSAESTYKVGGADVTLTAQWTPKTYTIVYASNKNDGVTAAGGTHAYNEAVTLPGAEILNHAYIGYTFRGWSDSSGIGEFAAGERYTLEPMPYADNTTVTMSAEWDTNYYRITYDLNGYTEDDLEYYVNEDVGEWLWRDGEEEYLFKGSDAEITLFGAFSDASVGEGSYFYVNNANNVRFGLGWSTQSGATSAAIPFGQTINTLDYFAPAVISGATPVEDEDGVYEITLYMVWSANYRALENKLSQFQSTYMTFAQDAATLRGADYSGSSYPVYASAPTSAKLPAIANDDAAYKAGGVRARELVPNTSDPAHGKYAWVAGGMTDTEFSDWDDAAAGNDFTAASLAAVNGKYKAILAQVIFDPSTQYNMAGTILPQSRQDELTTSVNRLDEAMNSTKISQGTGYILSALRLKDVDMDYRLSDADMSGYSDALNAEYHTTIDYGASCTPEADGGVGFSLDAETVDFLRGVFDEEIEDMYPACESEEDDNGEVRHHSFNSLLEATDSVLGKANEIFAQFGFDPTQARDDSADYFFSGGKYIENSECIYTTESVYRLFDLIYGQKNGSVYESSLADGVNAGNTALYYQVKSTLGSNATVLLRRPSQDKLNKIVTMIAYAYHSLEMKYADYGQNEPANTQRVTFVNLFQKYFDATWGTKLGRANGGTFQLGTNYLTAYQGYFTEESYDALADFMQFYFSAPGVLWPNGDGELDAAGRRTSFPYRRGVEQNCIDGRDAADGSVRDYLNGYIDADDVDLSAFNFAPGTLCSEYCDLIDMLEPATADYSEVFRLIAGNARRDADTNTFMVDSRVYTTDAERNTFYPSVASEVKLSDNYTTWYTYYADPGAYADRDAWSSAVYAVEEEDGTTTEKPLFDVEWLYRYYTEESVEALRDALAGIDWELNKLQQRDVDGKTGSDYSDDTICYAVKEAIDNLTPKEYQVYFYKGLYEGDNDFVNLVTGYMVNGRMMKYYFGMTVVSTQTPNPDQSLHKTFVGWNTLKNDNSGHDVSSDNIYRTNLVLDEHLLEEWVEDGTAVVETDDDVTYYVSLYGRYVDNVTLDIDMDGGSATMTPQGADSGLIVTNSQNRQPTYDYGTKLTFTNMAKKGYRFDHWEFHMHENNMGSSMEGNVYTFGYTNIVDLEGEHDDSTNDTLTAHWTPNTYTVTYNKNSEEATATEPMEPQSFTYDAEQALRANTFKRSGYRFIAWTTNADGTGYSYTDGQTVKNLSYTQGDTVNLYAKWEYARYGLTFHVPEGVEWQGWPGEVADQTVRGKTITFGDLYGDADAAGYTWPNNPVRPVEIAGKYEIHAEFLGWYTAENGGTKIDETKDTVTTTGSVDLYAHFNTTEIINEVKPTIEDYLTTDANLYTAESMQAIDEVLKGILDKDGEITQDDMDALNDVDEPELLTAATGADVTSPTVKVYENKAVTQKAITNGTYAGEAPGADKGEISYVEPGKCYYTYYCYTNSTNPAIVIDAQEAVGADGRASYPLTFDMTQKSGVVLDGWMQYTTDPVKNNTSGRNAGYRTLYNAVENANVTGLKYFGKNYEGTDYSYYNKTPYIVLEPTFAQEGGKQYALYTFKVYDDANGKNAADEIALAGAEGYGSYADGTAITTANAEVTPVKTVTIFVEYNNTMNGYEGTAGGQNAENGVGAAAGGAVEVYNNFRENGYENGVWVNADTLTRVKAGAAEADFIRPQAKANGKYESYLANDPIYGQNDIGSFIYVMKSSDAATSAYWDAYDRYLEENADAYREARAAGTEAAMYMMQTQAAAELKTATILADASKARSGDYAYWPEGDEAELNAPAATREESLVFVHIYDKWGNHYTNILQRDLMDNQAAATAEGTRGQVTVNELGGSKIRNITITELGTDKVVAVSGMTEDAAWNVVSNRFTMTGLPQGSNDYRYTMTITDNAGNEYTAEIRADENGDMTVAVNDETMGGSFAEAARTGAAAVVEPESSDNGLVIGTAAAPVTVMEVEPGAILPDTIEEAQLTGASQQTDKPDVYTFTVNETYEVNLFALTTKEYEVTLRSTAGGTLKAYVDGEYAAPTAGKITIPAGAQVQIAAAPNAGHELESLTMEYANGKTVNLVGAYNASINDDVTIRAVFVNTTNLVTVTVENGAVSGQSEIYVSPYSRVTVVAHAAPEGQVFAYWSQDGEDDVPVSFDEIYTFVVKTDVVMKANYADAETEVTANVSMDSATIMIVNGMYTLSYSGKITVPADAQIVEYGLLLTNQKAEKCTEENFVIGGKVNGVNVAKLVGQSLTNEGQCTINVNNVKAGQTRTGRLYLTVKLADGTTQTIYSTTWSELNTPKA